VNERALAIAMPPPAQAAGSAAETGPRDDEADLSPLALRDLRKRWRKSPAPVLDGLDLVLRPGTCTWVGGRNGAGKTTMLRIAAGLIEPDSGAATVWGLGMDVDRARYQRLVSFLPAGDRGLYARLTVRQQLELSGRLALIDRRSFHATIDRAIEDFNLLELAGRRVDRMSMGQRQRLRLAMTFLPSPEVVLLDEPLTSLDDEGAGILAAEVDRVLSRSGAVLWCSPDSDAHRVRFDECWLLREGALQAP
jgi:ABC-2 type transport system ATP-binding protein